MTPPVDEPFDHIPDSIELTPAEADRRFTAVDDAGLLLIAVGAILAFTVDVQTKGFDLHTIGVILMIVGALGALGALISLMFWAAGAGSTAGP